MSTYMKKNARKAQIRRQFLIITSAFFLAIILFLFGGIQLRSHQVQASSNEIILYKSIRVDAGDTLWTLADEYMGTAYDSKDDYISEVKQINHITESSLQAGGYIIVPYAAVTE